MAGVPASLVGMMLLALTLIGCRPAPLQTLRFRTLQRQTAFERAVSAVEVNCGGVHKAEPETGRIVSTWWDPDYGQGIPPKYIYLRYRLSVVPNLADDSADVRIEPQAVLCSVFASKDPDKRANECAPLELQHGAVVPDAIYEHHAKVMRALQDDIFRRD